MRPETEIDKMFEYPDSKDRNHLLEIALIMVGSILFVITVMAIACNMDSYKVIRWIDANSPLILALIVRLIVYFKFGR